MAKAAKVIKSAPAKRKAPAKIKRRSGPLVVDFHTHIMVRDIADIVQKKRPATAPEYQLIEGYRKGAKHHRAKHPRKGADRLAKRYGDMDAMGMDIHVISGHVAQFCYWADGKLGLEVARIGNDRLAEVVGQDPDRFLGLGMVPLQDVGRAVRELDRMVNKLGLRGVQIGTNIDGVELGDKKLNRFWAKAEALDIPVFVHPAGFVHPRFGKHLLWNSLGQPIEEAVAISSLIYEGIMDRHPKLKVCVAHGGGFLPFYTGRADRNFYDKPDAYTIKKSPTEYLKGFSYDTAFYNRDMLEFLVQKVGPSNIVMGADYPIGEDKPVAFIKKAKGISKKAQNMILGGNAVKLLNIR